MKEAAHGSNLKLTMTCVTIRTARVKLEARGQNAVPSSHIVWTE